MKLDKRIIKGKRPLTCFDTEEAEKYIGKLCYMCDEYNQFYKLNLIEPAILMGVEDCEIPFHYGSDYQAEFCLPCDWVTKEKQYRPYTIDEFMREFTIGNIVTFRHKANQNAEYRVIYNGYRIDSNGEFLIYFGIWRYTLQELFNQYELLNSATSKWQPFGVEE